ncbi:MAG: hypothetical protein JW993_00775 [Sedimentisphaerales bacterium]|nr:hypothetical protein [Sedimentisphaerales bacterium]
MTVRIIILFVLIAPSVTKAIEGSTFALVVNGINRDPEDRLSKEHTVQSLRQYLLTAVKVDPARLAVLDGNDASAPNMAKAMSVCASSVSPRDRFVFYYCGQANMVLDKLRLNLVGEDVTHEELARWLAGIRAGRQLIVLDCPCAGSAAQVLGGPGRVIVCAATQEQVYSTRFGAHFVPALARPESDMDGDGRVSVLEAFTAAAREIERWYRDREILPTETPCLEDNGDGLPSERPWRHTVEPVDGLAASTFIPADN